MPLSGKDYIRELRMLKYNILLKNFCKANYDNKIAQQDMVFITNKIWYLGLRAGTQQLFYLFFGGVNSVVHLFFLHT